MNRIRKAGFAGAVAVLVTLLIPTTVLAARSVASSNRQREVAREADGTTTTTGVRVPETVPGVSTSTAPPGVPLVPAPTTLKPVTPTTLMAKVPNTMVTTPPRNYSAAQYLSPDIFFLPYSPGQSSWEGTKNGVTMSVRIEPASPRAGEPIRFFFEATSADPCCRFHMVYGDGHSDEKDNAWSCPDGGPQSPGTRRWEYTHTYNLAGPKEFLFNPGTGNCRVSALGAGLQAWLDVSPGQLPTTQGPSAPTVVADDTVPVPGHENDRSYVTVYGQAHDQDGYVARMIVSWGDGSPDATYNSQTACTPGPSGWPVSFGNTMWLPHQPPPAHHYAQAGTYEVRVTAVTTGCGGLDNQTGSASFQWSAPSPVSG